MISLNVPTGPHWEQTYTLDGIDYVIGARYNQRENHYYLTIGSPSGDTYAGGVAAVCNWPLFCTSRSSSLPPGVLLITPNGSDASDPGLDEIGVGLRCELVYISAAERLTL
jgi:hypothetical protein